MQLLKNLTSLVAVAVLFVRLSGAAYYPRGECPGNALEKPDDTSIGQSQELHVKETMYIIPSAESPNSCP